MDIAGINDAIVADLLESGIVDAAVLHSVAAQTASGSSTIDRYLMQKGVLEEDALLEIVGTAAGLHVIRPYSAEHVDTALFQAMPYRFWESRIAVPTLSSGERPAMAVGLPYDMDLVRELAFHFRGEIDVFLAPSREIRQAITRFDPRSTERKPESPDTGDIAGQEDGGQVARAVEALVEDAVLQTASDIHLDTNAEKLRTRFRVDGVLQRYAAGKDLDGRAVLARLKLLAGLNVSERRLPQDGSCRIRFAGRTVELRISTLPTEAGESMVCRILDPKTLQKGWDDLGFPHDIRERFLRLIAKPSGLVVISGPTGSGKSTTLYTALRHLNDGSRKILTVEDPVEQRIDGIVQVQTHEAIGLGFGRVLRTALRHDPDVIMIGEIRDAETAEMACRAALVGRLVLATVHAGSAKLVAERLVNLGVPRYLVDEVLKGVLSQKLEPRHCSDCGGPTCGRCGGTGRAGRDLACELLTNES